MDIIIILIVICAAFIIGIIASMVGIGGSSLIVPILIFGLNLPPRTAVGTALVTVCFMGISSTARYYKGGLIDLKLVTPMVIGSLAGAQIGVMVNEVIPEDLIMRLFGLIMLVMVPVMLLKGDDKNNLGGFNPSLNISLIFSFVLLSIGFAAGFASGLLGIGGGLIMVPLLTLSGISMHMSVASSLFVMIFSGISGVGGHLSLGNVDLFVGLIMALGVTIGAQVGSNIALKLDPYYLKIIFGIVMVIIGLRMLMV